MRIPAPEQDKTMKIDWNEHREELVVPLDLNRAWNTVVSYFIGTKATVVPIGRVVSGNPNL